MASTLHGGTPYTLARAYDGENALQRVYAEAHGTLTALTPYALTIGQNGWLSWAVPDSAAFRYYIIVPKIAITSGDFFWGIIAGAIASFVTPSLSITAGHVLEMHNAAVADEGAAATGAENEFAVCTTTSTTSTTQDIILWGERIVGTT